MHEDHRHIEDYQMVVAAAPSITESYYKKYLGDSEAKMVKTQTYELLSHATVALVTSGIANELYRILPGQPSRERMLADYQLVRDRLGNEVAPDNAARIMIEKLSGRQVYDLSSEAENEFVSEETYE